jgi:hypothetical protein
MYVRSMHVGMYVPTPDLMPWEYGINLKLSRKGDRQSGWIVLPSNLVGTEMGFPILRSPG